MPEITEGTILALDIGTRRIGVARADTIARIAHPWQTLEQSETIFEDIARLVSQEHAVMMVIGLPRNLEGEDTAQTNYTRQFIDQLKKVTDVPLHWQDEVLTSHKAEQELQKRNKPYSKADIDALAATYILEGYLNQPSGSRVV